MAEVETKGTAGKIDRGNGGPEGILKRWFCVAVLPSGNIFKQSAEDAADFLEILSSATIAWVDYVTQDFDQEVTVAASQLGFNYQLASSFTAKSYLNYLDLDTEMGMKVPSV